MKTETKTNCKQFGTYSKRLYTIAIIVMIGIGMSASLSLTGCSDPNDGGTGGKNDPGTGENLPALSGTPVITGKAVVGYTLTADTSGMNGTGTYTFEWKRGNTPVGTNAATYTLTAADTGTSITVTVTCSGYSGNAVSAAKGPIAPFSG